MITAIIIGILYSCMEGINNALFFHVRNWNKKLPFDIHITLSIQRVIVLSALVFIGGIWTVIPSLLMFSFLHNGFYYLIRNRLHSDLYEDTWFAQSNQSSSLLTKYMTPWIRTILFVLGIISTIYLSNI